MAKIVEAVTGLNWERRYPFFIAAVSTCFWFLLYRESRGRIAYDLSSPLLNVVAISVGFMGAALSILLTAQHVPSLDKLKQTDQFVELVEYHWSGIRLGFLCVAVCLFAITQNPKDSSVLTGLPGGAWCLSCIWAQSAFYRALSSFRRLLIARPAKRPLPTPSVEVKGADSDTQQ